MECGCQATARLKTIMPVKLRGYCKWRNLTKCKGLWGKNPKYFERGGKFRLYLLLDLQNIMIII